MSGTIYLWEINKETWALLTVEGEVCDQKTDVEDSIYYFMLCLRTHMYNFTLYLAHYQPEMNSLYSVEDASTCMFVLWREAIYLYSLLDEFQGVSIAAHGYDLVATEDHIEKLCQSCSWEEWKATSVLRDFPIYEEPLLNEFHTKLRHYRAMAEHLLSKQYSLMPEFEKFVITRLQNFHETLVEVDCHLTKLVGSHHRRSKSSLFV